MGSSAILFISALALAVVRSVQASPTCSDPTLPLPEPSNPNCSSCVKRCNSITNFNSQAYCSCDPGCVAYGDCCVDFEQRCPVQFEASSSLRTHFQYRKTECFPIRTVPFSARNTVGIRVIDPSSTGYNFVAVCRQTGVVCKRISPYDLLEPNLAIPVTDTETGVNYVNYECAKCNNVLRVTPWIPQMVCDSETVSYLQKGNITIDTEEKLRMYLSLCQINYMIPQNVKARSFCRSFDRKCSPTCTHIDLVNLCENSYTVNYVKTEGSKIYANVYCAHCAEETVAPLKCAFSPGKFPILPPIFPKPQPKPEARQFSLSLLFDFNPSEGVTVGRKACPAGQKWIAASQGCRQETCPDDLRLVDNICLPATLDLELFASLFFNFTEDLNVVRITLDRDLLLTTSLTNQLKHLLTKEDKLDISLNFRKSSEHMIALSIGMNLLLDKNSKFNLESDLDNFTKKAIPAFHDELILLVHRSGINIANVIIMVDGNFTFRQAILVDCTWFRFFKDEFIHQNDTLTLLSSNELYTMERYRLLNKGALVCISNEGSNGIRLDVSQTLGILTLVLVTLSIICLIVRLVLQFKILYYQTFAGKLHFNLCLALCLAFLMLIVGGVVSSFEIMKVCEGLGTLTYWFFLTAFFWMFAVILDTWLVFRPSATLVRVDNMNRSLMKYVIPCWFIPAVVAVTVTFLDFVDLDPQFRPQFGVHLCWFNQRIALLVYFGVPVALLTILMTVFFILTVSSLKKSMDSLGQSNEKQSHKIWIYFRLYVLMGISWIFGFVASFVGHDALWMVFIILNGSQGVLIFISFVLNRRVLREIGALGNRSSGATPSTNLPSSSDNFSSTTQ